MTRFIRRNLQELVGLVYCSILALFCLFTGDPFFLPIRMLGYAVGVSCAGYWFWAIGDNARIDGLEAIVRGLERHFEERYKREHVDVFLSGVSSPEVTPSTDTYTRPPLPRPANRIEEEIRRRLASGDAT